MTHGVSLRGLDRRAMMLRAPRTELPKQPRVTAADSRSLDRVTAALLVVAGLAAGLCVAAFTVRFSLAVLSPDLKRPPRFSLFNASEMLGYGGASSTMLVVMALATLESWRRWPAARDGRWLARVLGGAAALLALGLACEVLQLVLIAHPAGRWVQICGQVCDLLAILSVCSLVLLSPLRALALEPRWSWSLALALAVAPVLAATVAKPGHSMQVYFWIRAAVYPAAFALCWDCWQRQRAVGEDAGTWSLLGIFLALGSALFVAFEMVLGDPTSGGLKASLLVSLAMVAANVGALVVFAAACAVRRRGDWRVNVQLVVGLVLLLCAVFPNAAPPWEHTMSLAFRLGIDVAQAVVGLLLILLVWVVRLLRRYDPLGGPPRAVVFLWALLGIGYLVSRTVDTWLWSHEHWVAHVQFVDDVMLRKRITFAFLLTFAATALMLVPPICRVVRRLWTGRPARDSTVTTS